MSDPIPYSPLDRPIQFLKGVGPKRADVLKRLGLLTARDLLFHVPRDYHDATTIAPIVSLETGAEANIVGRVVSKGVLPTRKGLRIFQAVVRDETDLIECAWPGQPYLDRVIQNGDLLLLTGSVRFFHGRQFQPKRWEKLAREGEDAPAQLNTVFPLYPATEGLSHRQISTLIADNLDALLAEVAAEEIFDDETLVRAGVPGLRAALEAMHRPDSRTEAEHGRTRLAFEELFFLQLMHARVRFQSKRPRSGTAFVKRGPLTRALYQALPFALTGAQVRVLREIGDDMAAARRMNRLLQGDVGSGKTVVALLAMLRAVENGCQAALMAPTEILAEQHVRTLRSLIGALPVRVELLTGRMGAAERRAAIGAIADGGAQITVGTHALIQDAVSFHSLGLAVVDEQHRFGVRQRLALAERGDAPDVLVMSATPIPRSLALTLYGDLDVSLLDERPPGRQPVRTVLSPPRKRADVLDFVRSEVRQGRQAYFVYPLVEESETLDLQSATEAFEELSTEVFPDLRVGLLHGQMPGDEKDAVMRGFASGEIDALVATTVIEVGIDVPNATVMVVEHAERFGLSQLHQLRGRVGRGGERSWCVLITGAAHAVERLRVFASTEDGFRIAEADMQLRGQGELFGDRQSGVPGFRFADLVRDGELLSVARRLARQVIDDDPELREHPRLRQLLVQRYGERVRLFHTG
jgi:ATP-dependent DNA helicase RecG